ncbi:transposase, partial [Xanthomonas campestris]|uniref:transposase n=1 Tax=Xanthomonas campestris TaxID=339 RepID=UPI0032E42B28
DNLALGEFALAHRWSPWGLVCPETSSYGWINFTGSRQNYGGVDTLHGKEDSGFGDSGYTGADKREELQTCKAAFFIAVRPSTLQAIGNKRERAREQRWEHFKASVRAKVEHPFRVIKRQFGYTKVRYRGLAKNTAQVLTLFALSNLWLKRKQLMPVVGTACL